MNLSDQLSSHDSICPNPKQKQPLRQRHQTPDPVASLRKPSPSNSPQKRVLPTSIQSLDAYEPPGKKFKHIRTPSPSWPADDNIGGREGSITNSPYLFPRHRSSSPGQPLSLEAAATMLSRAEDTGGTRTVKLTRGPAGSPLPTRHSTQVPNRHHSDHGTAPRSRATSDLKRSSGTQLLQSVALAEFLHHDQRPTFVVDLDDDQNHSGTTLHILFANHALRARPSLSGRLCGTSGEPSQLLDVETPFFDFKVWVLSQLTERETVTSFPFAGHIWNSVLIRKRLKVLTGEPNPVSVPAHDTSARPLLHQFSGLTTSTYTNSSRDGKLDTPGYFDLRHGRNAQSPGSLEMLMGDSLTDPSPRSPVDSIPTPGGDITYSDLLSGPISPSHDRRALMHQSNLQEVQSMTLEPSSERGFFDWTRLPLSPSLPEHIQFARGVDWASTSLGPIEEWAADLRGMCNLIMASPHPAAMYWGPDHVAIYNEAYILLAGQKHPELMGTRYCDAWAEIWDALKDVFDSAFNSAQATMKDDDCLFLIRNGFLEETYFSWSIIPLIGDNGAVVGLYNPAFEKTRRKVAERRMLTLREVGERTAAARQVGQFWSLLLEGLEYNEYDAPLVMVYSLANETSDHEIASSASSSGAASKTAFLEGSLGVPSGHPAAPAVLDMKTSNESFAAVFRQALTSDRPIILREDDGSLDMSLFEGIQWRGFGDPSRIVVVSPIHPTTGESTLGFLVMGTNPRRPYDEDYDLFIQLLGRQLATSIASVVLFEEEILKGEKAAKLAAQDRIELNNQLVARTQEAVEAENKFTRMAELAPVGMYIGDNEGKIVFVNDAWYDISSYPRNIPVGNQWIKHVVEEDQSKAWDIWSTMLTHKCAISVEFRFKTPWRDRMGNEGFTWVLASASPEKDEDGEITRVFGSMTDISSQKFAENLQTRRMEEAVELKRQQERYIDTTSHEMRNPLSAILQCADSITGSLTELREGTGFSGPQREILESTIDSAQTITLCAQHQKRIVDDVLTLSKLDSAMMAVTPVDVQPVTVVQRALKMFEGELQTADIALDFKVDKSYTAVGIDWVRLDPHRLSQVLINLTTNAIKFTTTQEKRTIRMFVAASTERPSQEDRWGLTFIPTRTPRERDVTASAAWGLGENIYIHFAVQDTGRGLDDLEKKQLFQRFSQANPRTHVTYGGSGLGLFISRELVELQGGEIGVASEAGKGSTFAFYVKARRSQEPKLRADDDAGAGGGFQSRKGQKGTKPGKVKSQAQSSPLATSSPPSRTMSLSSEEVLHVLVVEDNLINQKVLATQLRKIGCIVYVANHGGEAIEQIQQSKFWAERASDGIDIDVVLMDLEMPVMDGQTCARKLREMQKDGQLVRHIPVIAVTANAREEQIKMTLQSGIDDVVSKPFRIPELVPKMKDVIARFKLQRAEGYGS